jgi:Na+/proline symporter
MSTIDSALLSLGSTVTSDFMGPYLERFDENQKRQVSRVVSFALMVIMALLAIYLPQTIWALMVFKIELLIQLAPAIIIGVRYHNISAQAIGYGLLAGALVAVLIKVTQGMIFGVHAGVWGLLINLLVVFIFAVVQNPQYKDHRKSQLS